MTSLLHTTSTTRPIDSSQLEAALARERMRTDAALDRLALRLALEAVNARFEATQRFVVAFAVLWSAFTVSFAIGHLIAA
jgi:hypothetical protein